MLDYLKQLLVPHVNAESAQGREVAVCIQWKAVCCDV